MGRVMQSAVVRHARNFSSLAALALALLRTALFVRSLIRWGLLGWICHPLFTKPSYC